MRGRTQALSAAALLAAGLVACGPPTTPLGPAAPPGQTPGDTDFTAVPGTSAVTPPPGPAGQTHADKTQGTPDGPTPAGTTPAGTTPAGTTPTGTTPTASGTHPQPDPPPDSVTPSADWHTFTTSDGKLNFDYPPTWAVKDPAGEAAFGGEFVDVVNARGKPMAALRTNVVTGAQCLDTYPYEVLDSKPLQALAEAGTADQNVPRYVFETRGDATALEPSPPTLAAYGITMVPEATGPTACPMFHLFLWPPSGALFGQTYNPENNVTPAGASVPYLEKAKLYAATPEYQDIRKMITSLRPAGK